MDPDKNRRKEMEHRRKQKLVPTQDIARRTVSTTNANTQTYFPHIQRMNPSTPNRYQQVNVIQVPDSMRRAEQTNTNPALGQMIANYPQHGSYSMYDPNVQNPSANVPPMLTGSERVRNEQTSMNLTYPICETPRAVSKEPDPSVTGRFVTNPNINLNPYMMQGVQNPPQTQIPYGVYEGHIQMAGQCQPKTDIRNVESMVKRMSYEDVAKSYKIVKSTQLRKYERKRIDVPQVGTPQPQPMNVPSYRVEGDATRKIWPETTVTPCQTVTTHLLGIGSDDGSGRATPFIPIILRKGVGKPQRGRRQSESQGRASNPATSKSKQSKYIIKPDFSVKSTLQAINPHIISQFASEVIKDKGKSTTQRRKAPTATCTRYTDLALEGPSTLQSDKPSASRIQTAEKSRSDKGIVITQPYQLQNIKQYPERSDAYLSLSTSSQHQANVAAEIADKHTFTTCWNVQPTAQQSTTHDGSVPDFSGIEEIVQECGDNVNEGDEVGDLSGNVERKSDDTRSSVERIPPESDKRTSVITDKTCQDDSNRTCLQYLDFFGMWEAAAGPIPDEEYFKRLLLENEHFAIENRFFTPSFLDLPLRQCDIYMDLLRNGRWKLGVNMLREKCLYDGQEHEMIAALADEFTVRRPDYGLDLTRKDVADDAGTDSATPGGSTSGRTRHFCGCFPCSLRRRWMRYAFRALYVKAKLQECDVIKRQDELLVKRIEESFRKNVWDYDTLPLKKRICRKMEIGCDHQTDTFPSYPTEPMISIAEVHTGKGSEESLREELAEIIRRSGIRSRMMIPVGPPGILPVSLVKRSTPEETAAPMKKKPRKKRSSYGRKKKPRRKD